MATFTLPASRFPGIGANFLVGVPLLDSPPLQASEWMSLLETDLMIFLDNNGNAESRIASIDFSGPGPYPTDFEVPGGQGFLVINGKDNVTGADVVYNGEAWCTVFNELSQATEPCP